jgi:septum site-determining protein MinC
MEKPLRRLEGAISASLPQLRLRGRNVFVLVLEPRFPASDWFAALDRQLAEAPSLFEGRPIVVGLGAILAEAGPEAAAIVLEGLEVRGLKLIGLEDTTPGALANTPWARLATRLKGRDTELEPPPTPAQTSLLVDRPVRSGQSIVFPAGDVTILGSVSSGAEVLAGGSIHVYGALRGRAIAGLKAGKAARIFCRKLEAELVGVDQLYRTAEHWGDGLHGRAAQVLSDHGSLRLAALD